LSFDLEKFISTNKVTHKQNFAVIEYSGTTTAKILFEIPVNIEHL